MGKFIVIFLIVYFCFYIYRRFKYRDYYKYKIYDQLKGEDRPDLNDEFKHRDVIDVDSGEDELQRPKYLH